MPRALISMLRCTWLRKPKRPLLTMGGLSAVSTHAPCSSCTSMLTSTMPGRPQCAPGASAAAATGGAAAEDEAAEEEAKGATGGAEEEEEEEDMAGQTALFCV